MAVKLSSRQQAQLTFLQTLPPKLLKVQSVIEQMSSQQADEAVVRGLCRLLDQIKANAQSLGLGALAETTGIMATMARRNGGLQMKVRGLRELLGSFKTNFEGALRSASTPETPEAGEAPSAGG